MSARTSAALRSASPTTTNTAFSQGTHNHTQAPSRRALRLGRGFTLVETLAALLVVSMLTALVATTIPVAFRTYQGVQKRANAEVALTSVTTALRGELTMATDIEEGTGDVLFSYVRADGDKAELIKNEHGWLEIRNKATNETTPLVPEAMTEKLGYSLAYSSRSFDSDSNIVTLSGLEIQDGGTVLASVGKDGSTDFSFPVLRA